MIRILKITLLCAALCIGTAFTGAAESDINSEARGIVNSLNSIEDIITDDEITRSEFVGAVVRLMAYDCGRSAEISFSDVDREDKLYEILVQAVGENLITDGEVFRPDDEITVSEAMAICIRALGYEPLARISGSYPKNYISIARDLGLYDNISGDTLDSEKLYTLMFNMLSAEVLPAEYVSGETVKTHMDGRERETLLEAIYNVREIRGVVRANNYTAAGDTEDMGDSDRIVVDDITLCGGGEYNDLLGYNVTAYYVDDDDRNIVYMYKYKNNVVTIDAHDIKDAERDGKRVVVKRESDGRKYRTENSFELIYNGKYLYSYTDADLIPEAGSITLIDNDRDGEYDVYIADEYYYITDASVNLIKPAVGDKNNSANTVEFTDDMTYEIRGLADGAEIKLSEIADGDIFAVKLSRDGLLCRMYRLTEEISGEASAYDTEDGIIKIGDEEYNVSAYFARTYTNGAIFKGEMSFTVGIGGEIVSIVSVEARFEYGYLLRAFYNWEDDTCTVKLFTAKGKIEYFKSGEKLYVDGVKIENIGISAIVSDYQPVRYMTDAQNKLLKLDLAADGNGFVDAAYRDDDNSFTSYKSLGQSFYYRTATGCFYPNFNANSAIIFAVPEDKTQHDEYYIAQTSDFSNATYNVSPYDISSDGCAAVIVYNYRKNVDLVYADTTTPMIVVDKLIDTINSDDEPTKLMRGWCDGNFVEYYLATDIVINKASGANKLCRGDIIRAGLRGDELVSAVVEFDASPEVFGRNNVTEARSFNQSANGLQYQSGKVYSENNGYIYITSTGSGGSYDFKFENLRLFNVKAAKVVIVDEKGLRPGSLDEISTYRESGSGCDFAVLKQANLYTYTLVVYKEAV